MRLPMRGSDRPGRRPPGLGLAVLAGAVLLSACVARETRSEPLRTPRATGEVLTGAVALGDWSTDAPGVRRRITVAVLPPPYATPSVDNGPQVVPRPSNAWPQAPAGFKVELFAQDLD